MAWVDGLGKATRSHLQRQAARVDGSFVATVVGTISNQLLRVVWGTYQQRHTVLDLARAGAVTCGAAAAIVREPCALLTDVAAHSRLLGIVSRAAGGCGCGEVLRRHHGLVQPLVLVDGEETAPFVGAHIDPLDDGAVQIRLSPLIWD